ncbi:MAG: hypothetical protein K0Q66_2183, partial [Chitinophagaceae bacterium]|nr:hypothetical protein [Chitinophagaceae bacterium]
MFMPINNRRYRLLFLLWLLAGS